MLLSFECAIVVVSSRLRLTYRGARFSEDEQNGEPVNGVRRALQQTEDSDPSSVFDSVFMSLSDTLNSINTFESSDQTPEDIPQNTSKCTPLSLDTTR